MSMDKKSIAQFSDILRDKLLDETKAKAAYYRILPDTYRMWMKSMAQKFNGQYWDY